jgi:hypothetical protein
VLRCTVSRLLNPMVHGLRRQWGTSNGTVSSETQLLLPHCRGHRTLEVGLMAMASRIGASASHST